MKKLGFAIIIAGLVLLIAPRFIGMQAEGAYVAEQQAILDAKKAEEVIPETSFETEATTVEETEIVEEIAETEPEEIHFYEWIENYEINDFVGNIHVSVNDGAKEISTVVNFGGSEDSYIDNNAGLHEQISNKDELFILGHHMKNGTIFANLVYAQVGDIITFDTLEGEYVYVITDSFHVNVEEYEANDFAVCRGHDITLVTCDYGYGATGRHLVYGNLVSINGTIVE